MSKTLKPSQNQMEQENKKIENQMTEEDFKNIDEYFAMLEQEMNVEEINSDDERLINQFEEQILDEYEGKTKEDRQKKVIKENMEYYKIKKYFFNDLSVSGKEWRDRRNKQRYKQ